MDTLTLKSMSTKEKIEIMETLWEDLCENADSLLSPNWHNDVLKQREKKIQNGEEEFIDWDKAKKQIRDSIS